MWFALVSIFLSILAAILLVEFFTDVNSKQK